MSKENLQLPSLEELSGLLDNVLSGDNQKIQAATRFFKSYTKKSQAIGPLTYILSQDANSSRRQLSAILLKRNMVTQFSQLEEQAQTELKAILLQRFFQEDVNIIRTNIGQLIGVIAQQVLQDNKWPELYHILSQQTQKGQDVEIRKKGLILLSLIFDYSGDSLKPFYSTFFQFFVENLQDADKQIRSSTVKCLISLFDNISHMQKKEAQQYKTLVEPILGFVDQCIKEGDEDNAYHCFDAFSYLAEAKLTILDTHLGMIIQYAAGPNILLNKKCSSRFKECVIDFIYTVVETHRKILQSNNPLQKQLIEAICLVVAEPIVQADYEPEQDPIQDVALWLIEIICVSIQKKKVLHAYFLEAITALINTNDINKMNAGYLILAAITEGLQDQMRRNLANPIMNVLIPRGLDDPRVEVRGAAIKALTYFSEWLCPEFLQYDSVVIPYMLKNLNEIDSRVREKGLIALDIFAENMEEDQIKQYVPTLIPTMVEVFKQPQTNLKSRRLCIASIGSIVTSSRSSFSQFLKPVSDLLLQILSEKDMPEIMGIKAEAISCLGKIAEGFSDNLEVQNQLITPLAGSVYQLLIQNNDYEIREACLSFFYNMASAQKEGFAPIFNQIIEFTIKLAQSTEGITYEKKKQQGDFSLDTDSDEEENATHNSDMRVKSTQLDEKAAAIHALGQFAVSVPVSFGPYFKRTGEILDETLEYFYDNIRIQTIRCYGDLIEGLVKLSNNGVLPQFKRGLPCIQRFNQEIETMIQTDFLTKLLYVMTKDESYECVQGALDRIEELVKVLGPACIDGNLNYITTQLVNLLEKKAACFGVDVLEGEEFEEEQEEEENDEDTNESVFESLTSLIPQIGKALLDGFYVPFQQLLPSLLVYCNPEKDVNDNIQAIGCFAQLFEFVPSTISLAANQLLPILYKTIEVRDVELNRNVAYCLANFVEFGTLPLVESQLPAIIQTIRIIHDESGPYQAAIDNAAAAICRIIMRFPNALPTQQAFDSVLKLVPFKGDEQEEFTVIRMILHLGNTQPEIINSRIELVISILLDGLLFKEKYKIKKEKLVQLVQSVKSLAANQAYKQIIDQKFNSLQDDSQKTELIKLLQ